jgi:hypothetical protein
MDTDNKTVREKPPERERFDRLEASRRKRMWVYVVLAALFVVAVLIVSLVIWDRYFAPEAVSTAQSTSPSGMFRCTFTERTGWHKGGMRRFATVVVEKRKKVGVNDWDVVIRQEVAPDDDSAIGRYCILWDDDSERQRTVVTVFPDYGDETKPDPCLQKVIFTTSLPAKP